MVDVEPMLEYKLSTLGLHTIYNILIFLYLAFINPLCSVLNYSIKTEKEVFLSTYICHPSMANNELSGPVVTTALARYLAAKPNRNYTYRIVFIPETIGSISYLSRNLEAMKSNIVAGFNISCVGDDRAYSFLPSRMGSKLSDVAAQHVLRHIEPNFKRYSWLDRGSDERQYCAPGVDLPIASIMRTKYGEFPEYHTSLDNLENLVTSSGLQGGYEAIRSAIEVIEGNVVPRVTVLCEPQLGKRGLYPTLSTKESGTQVSAMMDMISYCDGTRTLLEIAEIIGEPFAKLLTILGPLVEKGLVEVTQA
jgi:aminopeptidase-like protein